MAPEVLTGNQYHQSVDIFSMALVNKSRIINVILVASTLFPFLVGGLGDDDRQMSL